MESAVTLVHALVASFVEYCNAVLYVHAECDDGQVATSVERHSSSGTTKFDCGLSRLLHAELHWLDVPGRVAYKMSIMLFSCMQPSSTVPDGFLPAGLQRRITASTLIRQLMTPGHSTLLAKYHRPTGFLCGWSISVELLARLLVRSCCWPRYIETTFENVCLLRTSAYSALEVLRLRAT